MESNALKDLIRRTWAAQGRKDPKSLRARHPENLTPIVELARPRPDDRALDVACGWGYVVQEFARRVRKAVGVDLTPEMIDLARRVAAERKVAGVEFHVGDVEALPFEPGSFEIVICRFSFHHFPDPARALREMRRVLAPGGRIVVYDFVAPREENRSRLHNAIEAERDPTHVRMYSPREFEDLVEQCGLAERMRVTTLWKREFEEWMSIVEVDAERKARVRRMLEETVEGNSAGLGPRVRNGKLTFTHTCIAWRLEPAS